MLKYIIFILIFNVLYFAQALDFDIYEISDRKPAENNPIKRQLPAEGKITITNDPQHSIETLPRRPEDTISVKKDLKQNDKPLTNVSSPNAQASDTKNNQQQEKKVDSSKQESRDEPNPTVLNSNSTSGSQNKTEQVIAPESNKNSNSTKDSSKPGVKNPKHAVIEHPGAALRGFYVFLGLSVLIIIYFVFKAFRLRPGAPPPATVRKYGIVGRRNDMEMLPLPLVEEDDDDTLFDMGTQVNR